MRHPQVPLGDIADFINGAAFKPEDWGDDGLPIIRIQNLTDSSKPFNYTRREVSEKLVVNPGDLLVSWSATLGVFRWKGPQGLLNQHIFRVVPDDSLVDSNYLRHALGLALDDMERHLHGATMKHVNRGEFLGTRIPLPPLEEQRRIAAILDKATELEILSMKQSSLLEDAEKHLFLEYFGSPFPGKTPWPVALLGELGSLERGISKHRPRNDPSLMDGPYPFIQTGDVAGCRGRITTFSATYSEKGLAQSRLWPAGTLCITIAANIAKTGILDFDACFPDSVVGFQDKNPAIITYVQCWMSFLQGHIEQMAPESAQKNINLEILRGLSVPVPSEVRLEKFHAAVLALRRTWLRSAHRRGRAAELRSSLQSVSFAA